MDEKDQNFNVLGGFEDQFQPSAVDFLDFPLHCKGNLKGNQGNQREVKKIHFGGLKLILKPT